MSTSTNDDRNDHQSGISLTGPHSFVRLSVKSVIKALSGRRQSPSPTFQRSLIEVVSDAERTDRDYFAERFLSAMDGSEGFPPPEAGTTPNAESMEVRPEVRLGLDESGVKERVRLKLL
jgi:hypothetical protein